MKRFTRQILSLVLAGATIFAPLTTYAKDGEATPVRGAQDLNVSRVNHELLSDGKPLANVSVESRDVNSPEEAKEALKWFSEQQAKSNAASSEKIAVIPLGADSSEIPAGFQKVEIAPQEVAALANDLGREHKSISQRFKSLTKRLPIGRFSLAVIRIAGVGGAAYTGFMFSKLPSWESFLAASTIGVISATFQFKWYTNLLQRKGALVRGTQSLAASIVSNFGLDYEKTLKSVQNSMPFDFAFNQAGKIFVIAAGILSIINFEFYAMHLPLYPDFESTVVNILKTAGYTVIGQGTLDTAIATDNHYAKKENGDEKAVKRIEITTSIKILSVALVANFATTLVGSGNPDAILIGKQIVNGVTLGGLTYWGYNLYRYNDWVRNKIKSASSLCQRLLTTH